MSQLVIRLEGSIENTNFEEWKVDFVSRIRSVDTSLVTEEDFARAEALVKRLKSGEKTLREARRKALDQTSEIRELFEAIDTVAAESRQTRLALERQIRARKQEIKERLVREGIQRVRELIEAQSESFRDIDPGPFLAPEPFWAAIKGKASTKGAKTAIQELLDRIDTDVTKKAAEVDRNAAFLAALPAQHRILFQDRGGLLALDEVDLRAVVDRRVAAFVELKTPSRSPDRIEDEAKVDAAGAAESDAPPPELLARYRLTLDLYCTREAAVRLARSIRDSHGDDEAVTTIRLARIE